MGLHWIIYSILTCPKGFSKAKTTRNNNSFPSCPIFSCHKGNNIQSLQVHQSSIFSFQSPCHIYSRKDHLSESISKLVGESLKLVMHYFIRFKALYNNHLGKSGNFLKPKEWNKVPMIYFELVHYAGTVSRKEIFLCCC